MQFLTLCKRKIRRCEISEIGQLNKISLFEEANNFGLENISIKFSIYQKENGIWRKKEVNLRETKIGFVF